MKRTQVPARVPPRPVILKCHCTWWLVVQTDYRKPCGHCGALLLAPRSIANASVSLREALARAEQRYDEMQGVTGVPS